MKKNLVLGIIGGAILVSGAVVAYVKREAIKEVVDKAVDEVKKKLKCEKIDDLSSVE